jgi:hypothetical protein
MSKYSDLIIVNRNTLGPYIFVGCWKTQVSDFTSSTVHIFLFFLLSDLPIVTVAPLTYNGNIGGSVTLGCQVVANPAATNVYWIKSKNSQDITISSTTSKYSFSTNNPSLTINSLSSDDDATYVCYATNSIGTGNSQAASLNVIGSKYYKIMIILLMSGITLLATFAATETVTRLPQLIVHQISKKLTISKNNFRCM